MYRIETSQKSEPEARPTTENDETQSVPKVQASVTVDPPEILIQKMVRALNFEEFGVHRRAALGFIPLVQDPEFNSKMKFSRLKSDRAIEFLGDGDLAITMDGGYRLCRVSRPLRAPFNFYWEFKFASAESEDSHVRLGIATLSAKLDRPVACDETGYCVRDKGGAFHNSMRTEPRQSPSFTVGDVVGFGMKSTSTGVELRMWLNGVDCGALFDDIDGSKAWFPAVSVYRRAIVEGRFERPFYFEPGEEWIAAENAPNEDCESRFTSQQIIDMMRGAPLDGDTQQILAAMDAALTPVNEMPI